MPIEEPGSIEKPVELESAELPAESGTIEKPVDGIKKAMAAEVALIEGYTESINKHGELQVSGVYSRIAVEQTVPCNPPCLLFVDPANGNFMTFDNVKDVSPDLEFVKFIKGIA